MDKKLQATAAVLGILASLVAVTVFLSGHTSLGGFFGRSVLTPTSTSAPPFGSSVAPTPTSTVTSLSTSYLQITQTQQPTWSSSLQVQDNHNWVDNHNTCVLSESGYQVSIHQAGRSTECLAQNSDASLNNIVIRVQMQVISGKDAGGIFFRNTNSNGYFFTMNASGDYGLYLAGKGRYLKCDPTQCHTSYFKSNQPNILGIIVNGNHIEFWVNDHQIFTLDDKDHTFSAGTIGFGAVYGSQPSQVVFSTLQVWVL